MVNYFVSQPWNDPRILPPEILDLSVVEIEARAPKSSARRSTSDKTGQHTRHAWRVKLLKKYGGHCHLCVAAGVDERMSAIDLTLSWPDRMCFTRDHVKPRSMGGRDSLANQRPAHRWCNESRGSKTVDEWVAYMKARD